VFPRLILSVECVRKELAMRKSAKSSSASKSRRKYSTPKLTTHGTVAKLTQGHAYGKVKKSIIDPGSGILSF